MACSTRSCPQIHGVSQRLLLELALQGLYESIYDPMKSAWQAAAEQVLLLTKALTLKHRPYAIRRMLRLPDQRSGVIRKRKAVPYLLTKPITLWSKAL